MIFVVLTSHCNFDKITFNGLTLSRLNILRSIKDYKLVTVHFFNFRMAGKEHVNKVEFLV